MPRSFVAIGVLAALFLALPILGLVVRAPWGDMAERLTRPGVGEAIRLSALCATASTAVALALGVPLGWLLAYRRFPGQALLRAVVLVPLLLPPLVSGVGLFSMLAAAAWSAATSMTGSVSRFRSALSAWWWRCRSSLFPSW